MSSCYISPFVEGTPIGIAPGCPRGFYCPESLSRNIPSEICPSTTRCASLRLKGIVCEPQGLLEPILCPPGYLCANGASKELCPGGHFCPSGSYKALSCGLLSMCKKGSWGPVNFFGVVICAAIDILFSAVLVYRGLIRRKSVPDVNLLGRWHNRVDDNRKGGHSSVMPVTKRIEQKLKRSIPKKPTGAAKINSNFDDDTFVVVSNLDLSGKISSGDLREYLESIDDPEKDSEAILSRIRNKDKAYELDDLASETKSSLGESAVSNSHIEKIARVYKKFLGEDALNASLGFENVKLYGSNGSTYGRFTGAFKPGMLSAIVGGRGACEAEFIETLAGRRGNFAGEIRLNKKPIDPVKLRSLFGYVKKDPKFFCNLTVRENVLYSGRIKRPRNATGADIRDYAQSIIDALELGGISNVIATSNAGSSLDVAQKIRLAIAMELMSLPRVLFFNDSTSGMGHVAALELVRALKSFALMGITVIGAFNDLSNQALRLFDEVSVVGSGGEVVYLGPQSEIQRYFEGLGFHFPEYTNFLSELVEIGSGNCPTQMRQALSPNQLLTCWESHIRTMGMVANDQVDELGGYGNHDNSGAGDGGKDHVDKPDRGKFQSIRKFFGKIGASDPNVSSKGHSKMVKKLRGAPWFLKIWIYLDRAFIQIMNTRSAIIWEILIPSFFGSALGFAASGHKKELLRGAYVSPLESISTSSTYWGLLLLSVLLSVLVNLVGSITGSDESHKDKEASIIEYSSGQHSFLAYYIAVTIVSLLRVGLSSLHLTSFFLLTGKQPISLVDGFEVIAIQTLNAFFISSILGLLNGRGGTSKYYPVLFNTLSALMPGLNTVFYITKNTSRGRLGFPLNPNLWAMEIFVSKYARVYSHAYRFDESYIFGLNINRTAVNFMCLAGLSLVTRLVSFFALRTILARSNSA